MPLAGGVLDQPAGLMDKLTIVENVYRAHKEYYKHGNKPGQSAQWKQDNEDLYNVVLDVNGLREKYG